MADARVCSWLDRHVHLVHVDLDEDRELAREFAVHSVPTMVFLRPDRTVLGSMLGYRDVEPFLAEAERRLQGVSQVDEAQQQVGLHPDSAAAQHELFMALAHTDRSSEALQAARSYWELSRKDMSQAGVRASFFLGEMREFAARVPSAKAVMQEWLHDARERLQKRQTVSAAVEFAGLAQQLEAVDELVDAIQDTDKRSLRKCLGALGGQLLVRNRRYAAYVATGACSARAVRAHTQELLFGLGMLPDPERHREMVRTAEQEAVAQAVEALAGVDQVDEAWALIQSQLGDDPAAAKDSSDQALASGYTAMCKAVQRAGNADLTRRLGAAPK